MVSSLKEAHGSGMTLYDASREFLRVFVNAANHIPRHRRVKWVSCLSFISSDDLLYSDTASSLISLIHSTLPTSLHL